MVPCTADWNITCGHTLSSYDTGEHVYVDLAGVGVNLDVRLNQSELKIAPTYIGMANFKNFTINNRGNEIVSFHFSQFATEFEEEKGLSNKKNFKKISKNFKEKFQKNFQKFQKKFQKNFQKFQKKI